MEAGHVEWDFFIAHSSKDTALAEQLFEYLTGSARVFLDVRSLEPGMDWDVELPAAQRRAKATVVLVSAHTDAAYYQRVEIRQAIDLARPPGTHLVVPLITVDDAKEGLASQYGLSLKQSLTLSDALVSRQRRCASWASFAASSSVSFSSTALKARRVIFTATTTPSGRARARSLAHRPPSQMVLLPLN